MSISEPLLEFYKYKHDVDLANVVDIISIKNQKQLLQTLFIAYHSDEQYIDILKDITHAVKQNANRVGYLERCLNL